ncbi:hypothetical protein [Methylobacterium nodulans]|uniref:ABC transporter substrate-binding protein n=1 Tax=Methylobacterium nodulans (strain LMG 21967 / CNCM I-2342 / ORS 2060) TaxID=460265 RepID=B8IE86_METNO|nr:hypothetical protein [Methylobacterium nodulans]ACL57632.1 hypothetical protein Mnod_2669 [Methylobacterium nodulans ORS 2060]
MRRLLVSLVSAPAAAGSALAEPTTPDLKVGFVPGPDESAFKAAIRADRFYYGFKLPDYFE